MMQMTCTQLSDKDCFYISESRNKLLSYPIHCHADYELNFMEHGRGVRRVVGDSDEIIGESDLVLITGKDLEHVWDRTGCESSDVHEITIHFSADLFEGSFMHKTHFQSIFTMLEKAQRGLAFSEECVQKVYPMFNALVGEKRGFYAVLRFMAILHELSLDEQARILSSNSFARVRHVVDSLRVNKVQDYVEEHYMEEIRLSTLADMVGMTSVSFSRFFRHSTGQTFSDYLIAVRLEHASRLLLDSHLPIAEVCFECGFNNLSNFNRIFKKNKHCAPKAYRENYRKQKIVI